jgi:hypothetical protein
VVPPGLLERLDPLLVVADQAGHLDPGDVVPARGEHVAAPRGRGERNHRADRDQHGDDAPERELAPHAAAIDDQVGIERHLESPARMRRKWRPRMSWSRARKKAPQLWRMKRKGALGRRRMRRAAKQLGAQRSCAPALR